MSSLSIGQLAKQVGVRIDTVRSDIEQRIAELQRIRAGLREVVKACPGHGRAAACPILNALNQETSA
jgi:hypothetical protein